MGTNPEISKNTHQRTFRNIAVFITRFLAPTSGRPIPGAGAAGLPFSIPRGAATRGGTFEGTMRFVRTGTGNGRMNWRRRLGKFLGLRGRVRIHGCREGRLQTHSRATRIFIAPLGNPIHPLDGNPPCSKDPEVSRNAGWPTRPTKGPNRHTYWKKRPRHNYA